MRTSHAQRLAELDTILWHDPERPGRVTLADITLLGRAEDEAGKDLERTCDKATVAQIIDLMAEMFQADTPSADALQQWFSVLGGYPPAAVKAGARSIVRTHRWPRLPLPADFVAAIEGSDVWSDLKNEFEMRRLSRQRAARLYKKFSERG